MPITSFSNQNKNQDLIQASDLPFVIHGPMSADITLICHGKISDVVVESAHFLDNYHQSISVNVVQIKQLEPFPVKDLLPTLLSLKYLMLIESDVEQDLFKSIYDHLGIKLYHHQYFNPNQAKLAAKIVALVESTFLITK